MNSIHEHLWTKRACPLSRDFAFGSSLRLVRRGSSIRSFDGSWAFSSTSFIDLAFSKGFNVGFWEAWFGCGMIRPDPSSGGPFEAWFGEVWNYSQLLASTAHLSSWFLAHVQVTRIVHIRRQRTSKKWAILGEETVAWPHQVADPTHTCRHS